jgi:hypothetical protein
VANYFEKIAVIIDVTSDKAVAGLKTFRKSVAEAEGFSAKFSAGVGSLKQSFAGLVKGPSGPAAIAAGAAAIGAAWMKAGQTFIDTARSARDLSVATGLGIEDASRLIEVFGDLGGDSASLAQAVGKISKSLDNDKWTRYGIATREAGGEARDANDIFLESLEVLRQIKNPTEQAAAGNALFGRSWANLAPLIAKSDKELRAALKSVKDGKVITGEEADQADRLAEGFDNIRDSVDEMILAAGKALSEMVPLLDGVALGIEAVAYDIGLVMDAANWIADQTGAKAARQFEAMQVQWNAFAEAAKNVNAVMVEYGDANKYAAQEQFNAAQKAAELEQKLANRRGGVAFAAAQAEQSISDMMDAISDDRQWISVQLAMDDLEERLAEITKQYEDGEIDQREYWLLTRDEILKTKGEFTAYLDEQENMDPYLKQRLLFEFDQGDIDSILKIMQDYLDGKKIAVTVGSTAVPGMPFIGGTGPKDMPYQPAINITVNGALDPNSTAAQIKQILDDHSWANGQQVVWNR